jgi:hypothetical protein
LPDQRGRDGFGELVYQPAVGREEQRERVEVVSMKPEVAPGAKGRQMAKDGMRRRVPGVHWHPGYPCLDTDTVR